MSTAPLFLYTGMFLMFSEDYIFFKNEKFVTKKHFFIFQLTNIYSNTLVHSFPHLPVYCMGRWVRLHCFFKMGIIDMIQHFMHEILKGSSQYFTSYYIESMHLCESEGLGWAVKGKKSHFVELRVTYLGKCT
jgi:hypothetical protein